jgi:Fe-S-cluster containining protein
VTAKIEGIGLRGFLLMKQHGETTGCDKNIKINYAMSKKKKNDEVLFDCIECPAFCCGFYGRVIVEDSDVERMAQELQIPFAEAEKRFTRTVDGERLLRRRKDHLLGESCKFLHPKTRGCTIYSVRPEICRVYPNTQRCVYYDLWKFEQEQQEGRGRVIPLVQITFPDEK